MHATSSDRCHLSVGSVEVQSKIERIRHLSIELDEIGKTALEKASEVGRLLMECKDSLKHGEWLPWLESNFTFTDRTARRWMKLAEAIQSGKIKSDTVSNLAEAYRITTEPKVVSDNTFKMPLPNERLIMLATNGDCAVIEPMDDTYVQVTYTEPCLEDGQDCRIGSVCGTKRGIHKEHAWSFLCAGSHADWKNAIKSFVPWSGQDSQLGTKNKNLYTDEVDWIHECLELLQGGQKP
jgi:hypothetical protein